MVATAPQLTSDMRYAPFHVPRSTRPPDRISRRTPHSGGPAMLMHDIPLESDGSSYRDWIFEKADMLRAGHRAGRDAAPQDLDADGLLFAGMGGSGLTASLVQDAATRAMSVPTGIVRHYNLPRCAGEDWHVLALSYSGTTEETLQVAREAGRRGLPVTGFTTGGDLAPLCQTVVAQPTGYQPRAALGHAWMSVLGFLEGCGVLDEPVPVARATEAVGDVDRRCGPEIPEQQNEAKQLARKLVDVTPHIYATPAFDGVARVLRAMLNENAKKIATVEAVPECNHNDLVAWGGDEGRRHCAAVVLSHADQNPQLAKRLEFMRLCYQEWAVPWHHHRTPAVHDFQDHAVAQAGAIQFAEYTSFYLAMLRGVDPAEIELVDALKSHLSA